MIQHAPVYSNIINYYELFKSFGISCPLTLPCTTTCPLCNKEKFKIFKESVEGEWFYCADCKFTGNIVELYQHYHKISSPVEALVKLFSDVNFKLQKQFNIEKIQQYCDEYIVQRHTVLDFWEKASTDLEKSPDTEVTRILQYLDLWKGLSSHRFNFKLNNLVGVATAGDIKKAIPSCKLPSINNHKKIILIPFFDFPGRIKNFLGIYLKGMTTPELIYINADNICNSNYFQNYNINGAAMLNLLTFDEPYIIVMNDIRLALKLQVKSITEETGKPLPIIVYKDKKTCYNTLLNNNKVIFYVTEPYHKDFNEALKLENLVNTFTYFDNKLFDDKFLLNVNQIVTHIVENSVDMLSSLKTLLDQLNLIECIKLLNLLDLTTEQKARLINICETIEEKKKLQRILGEIFDVDTIYYLGKFIYEKDNCWYYRPSNNLIRPYIITDTIFIIEQVVNTYEHGKFVNMAKGVVKCGLSEVAFEEPLEVIRTDTLNWLNNVAITKLNTVPQISVEEAKHLFNISLGFKKPKVIKGIQTIGWSYHTRHLILPNVSINERGELKETPFEVLGQNVPCNILEYRPSTLTQVGIILSNKDHRLYWVILGVIAHNLMSKYYGLSKVSLLCHHTNEMTSNVKRLADSLLLNTKTVYNTELNLKEWINEENKHDLPLVVSFNDYNYIDILFKWITNPAPKNSIVVCDVRVLDKLIVKPSNSYVLWQNHNHAYHMELDPSLFMHSHSILVDFIRYLLNAKIVIKSLMDIYEAIFTWMNTLGFDARTYNHLRHTACELYIFAHSLSDNFFKLVKSLEFPSTKVKILPDRVTINLTKVIEHLNKNEYYLPMYTGANLISELNAKKLLLDHTGDFISVDINYWNIL